MVVTRARAAHVRSCQYSPASFDNRWICTLNGPARKVLNWEWVGPMPVVRRTTFPPEPYPDMESCMSNLRLRTKFLLSLLAISAGLTAATLLIVSYSVRKRVRENIREDVRNSAANYQSFQQQQEKSLARSAALLANLPNVRAL